MTLNNAEFLSKLDTLPGDRKASSYYFSDYIELHTLVSIDNRISLSDVLKIINTNVDLNLGDSERSSTHNKWEERVKNWFGILEERMNSFGDVYPFEVESDFKIKAKKPFDEKHYTYIFLLLSANKKYLMEHQNQITTDFEVLSKEAFRQYLPSYAETYLFGKSMVDLDRYTGHITNKINLLAKDLDLKPIYDKHYFTRQDTGDGGIDIVAWTPLENDINKRYIQIYLVQCSTGEDWKGKQDDCDKFLDYIHFHKIPEKVMFVPKAFRNQDGTFNEEKVMRNLIFFDRLRIIKLLKNDFSIINSLETIALVNQIIELEKDIV